MSVPPSSAHQTMYCEAPSAIVQKYFTPFDDVVGAVLR